MFSLYGKILNLNFAVLTSPSLCQYSKVSVWDFLIKTSLSVNITFSYFLELTILQFRFTLFLNAIAAANLINPSAEASSTICSSKTLYSSFPSTDSRNFSAVVIQTTTVKSNTMECGSCVLKASVVKCRSISSIDPQSTLDQHLSDIDRHLGWHSINISVDSQSRVN